MSIIRGEVSIVDLTDSRSLVAYISSNNRRQVIYDPDTDSYLPDFSEDPLTLTPELYIAGGGANIVDQVSSLRWTAQTNSMGRFEEITNGNGYSIGSNHELTINRNIFEDLTSILFRVEMVYHDDNIDRDIYVQADIELVRLSNGQTGRDGSSGDSSYVWIRYSTHSDGRDMSSSPNGASYMGVTTTLNSEPPSNPSAYQWAEIRGEQGAPGERGEDGRTPYTHFAWANTSENLISTDSSPEWQTRTGSQWHVPLSRIHNLTDMGLESGDYIVVSVELRNIHADAGDIRLRYRNPSGENNHSQYYQNPDRSGTYTFVKRIPQDVHDVQLVINGEDITVDFRNVAIRKLDNFSPNGFDGAMLLGMYTDFEEESSNNPLGYEWTRIRENGTPFLTIDTPDGTTIRNSEGTLRAVADLLVGTDEVTPTEYRWYKRLPNASGDELSGLGWQRLDGSTNYGTEGYNSRELVIPEEGITGNATYMVIVTYEARHYRRQVSVYDITDPYTVSVLGDSFFRNGRGVNTYEAKLYRNGEEVDESGDSGYTYTWHQYSSNGQKVTNFEKSGKQITVSSSEFNGQGDLRVTVTR